MNVLQRIEKRDLLYVIIFLLYNLLILFTWKFASATLLVSQVTLATSILSMMIAVFAMIYALTMAKEAWAQNQMVREMLEKTDHKMDELKRLEKDIRKQVSENSKISEGIQWMSQGLQQLKNQENLSKNVVKQIEALEQKNQDLMDQVVGLSDLSMIYHKEEVNAISELINKYEIGDWFTLEELTEKVQLVNPEKKDQDVQNMILFYLAHLNLLDYIQIEDHKYMKMKNIPIIDKKN